MSRRLRFAAGVSLLVAAASPCLVAQTLPPGFRDSVVFSGLTLPTAVAFSPDGRVFVAEKSGLIKVFASLTATTPTLFADLSTEVYNYWDRGLLGLALDPAFPTKPYVYVLYTYDGDIGGPAPKWGTPGVLSDPCPSPPGATADGCTASGRLSRLTASGSVMAANSELVLVHDWFQQYPSHSIGSVVFGTDGALYASGGDGANFDWADYGQGGNPKNPGGDPPVGVGGIQTPPTAEGGALRSQDLGSLGDPTGLNGSVIRIDPATGAGLPGNPLYSSSDPNARRIVAEGFRNPFRFTVRPGTGEIWVGDVGWSTWEEIDRIGSLAPLSNFGWPCYEGVGSQPSFDALNLNLCESLYLKGTAVTSPYFTYNHSAHIVANETCPTGSSSITGLSFYTGSNYPASYKGALFFGDHSRKCIWAMLAGANGDPDPNQRQNFVSGTVDPVQLVSGPGGDLFFVDLTGGKIHRVQYMAPTALLKAIPTSGNAPLTVAFDATGSTHPVPGEPLTYSWDLDGDGVYGDATTAQTSWTYTVKGSYTVGLRVTDSHGGMDGVTQRIDVSNLPPVPKIVSPVSTLTWKVGDVISFSGSATDPEDGVLPASKLSWSLVIQHCPSNCHTHPVQSWAGVASGSFSGQDHEYPSYLELTLTATDSKGLQASTTAEPLSEDRVALVRVEPAGAAARGRQRDAGGALRADRDHRLRRTPSRRSRRRASRARATSSRAGPTEGRRATTSWRRPRPRPTRRRSRSCLRHRHERRRRPRPRRGHPHERERRPLCARRHRRRPGPRFPPRRGHRPRRGRERPPPRRRAHRRGRRRARRPGPRLPWCF